MGVGSTSFFYPGHSADCDPVQRESGGCEWQIAGRSSGSYVLALQGRARRTATVGGNPECCGGQEWALLRDAGFDRSEEHTSELQSLIDLVCRLLLEKKKKNTTLRTTYTRDFIISFLQCLSLARASPPPDAQQCRPWPNASQFL